MNGLFRSKKNSQLLWRRPTKMGRPNAIEGPRRIFHGERIVLLLQLALPKFMNDHLPTTFFSDDSSYTLHHVISNQLVGLACPRLLESPGRFRVKAKESQVVPTWKSEILATPKSSFAQETASRFIASSLDYLGLNCQRDWRLLAMLPTHLLSLHIWGTNVHRGKNNHWWFASILTHSWTFELVWDQWKCFFFGLPSNHSCSLRNFWPSFWQNVWQPSDWFMRGIYLVIGPMLESNLLSWWPLTNSPTTERKRRDLSKISTDEISRVLEKSVALIAYHRAAKRAGIDPRMNLTRKRLAGSIIFRSTGGNYLCEFASVPNWREYHIREVDGWHREYW